MKVFAALAGAAGIGAICWVRPSQDTTVRVLIMGNHQGYLSPCGCSDPMVGGILREASLVRTLKSKGPTVLIDSGDLTHSASKQEVMKVHTLVQTLKSLDVAAISLTRSELKLGPAELINLQDQSGDVFTTANESVPDQLTVDPFKVVQGFLILGVSNSNPFDASIKEGLLKAKDEGLKTLVVLEGSEDDAKRLAAGFPALDVIVFRSASTPAIKPERLGKTILVSPGERGEYLLELSFSANSEPGYSSFKLTPDVKDDKTASRLYSEYLREVDRRKDLWDDMPRLTGKAFVGSATCGKCHESDYRIWKDREFHSNGELSSHSHALQTLIDKGHGRDPECVPCHVTRSDLTTGYHSREQNPQLAFVGCESCHGAGAEHAANPMHREMPQAKRTNWPNFCEACHTTLNSQNFDFKVYWERIKHGNGDNRWKSKK